MAVPTGAQRVEYRVAIPNRAIMVILNHPVDTTDEGKLVDGALEAAAEAIIDYFEAQLPGSVITFGRSYTGTLTEDEDWGSVTFTPVVRAPVRSVPIGDTRVSVKDEVSS